MGSNPCYGKFIPNSVRMDGVNGSFNPSRSKVPQVVAVAGPTEQPSDGRPIAWHPRHLGDGMVTTTDGWDSPEGPAGCFVGFLQR